MSCNPKLVKIILIYSNGKRYILKGNELRLYNDYINMGLQFMKTHGYALYDWDSLMLKIYNQVGISIGESGEEK